MQPMQLNTNVIVIETNKGRTIRQSKVCSFLRHIDGLVQEKRNSSASALELRLSYTLGREYRVMR